LYWSARRTKDNKTGRKSKVEKGKTEKGENRKRRCLLQSMNGDLEEVPRSHQRSSDYVFEHAHVGGEGQSSSRSYG